MLSISEIRASLRGRGKLRKPKKAFWAIHYRWKRTLELAGVRITENNGWRLVDISSLTRESLAQALTVVQAGWEVTPPSSATDQTMQALAPGVSTIAAQVQPVTTPTPGPLQAQMPVVAAPQIPKPSSSPAPTPLPGQTPNPPVPRRYAPASRSATDWRAVVGRQAKPKPGPPPIPCPAHNGRIGLLNTRTGEVFIRWPLYEGEDIPSVFVQLDKPPDPQCPLCKGWGRGWPETVIKGKRIRFLYLGCRCTKRKR